MALRFPLTPLSGRDTNRIIDMVKLKKILDSIKTINSESMLDGGNLDLVKAEDTGWKNGDGFRYRKKNGLLFVAFGDYTPSENIPAQTAHTIDTLPQEYRPSARVLGVIISGNATTIAAVETDGAVKITGLDTVVTAGTIMPLRGQLITIV